MRTLLLIVALTTTACGAQLAPCVVHLHVWTDADPAPATLAERVARAERDATPTHCSTR